MADLDPGSRGSFVARGHAITVKDTMGTQEATSTSDEPALRDLPRRTENLPRALFMGVIRLYQLTLSRLLPAGSCRFQPTCSHYAIEALTEYGSFKGSWLALRRLSKCHPWHHGGFDPLPKNLKINKTVAK